VALRFDPDRRWIHVSERCIVLVMLTCEVRGSALARLGRALADPTRCRILVALLDGVSYPGELAAHLGLTRSNVSNHLACLRGCGLVVASYEGRQVRYALADVHLARALEELVQMVLAVDADQPCVDRSASPTAITEVGVGR
jgi:ArsR family transcriptional regulator, cadmium/lead-responsive transcriptional repressor